MFKKIRFMLLALVVALGLLASPALAYNHFVINVYKDTGFATASGGYSQLTSGVTYMVLDYDASPQELETIYSDTLGTSKTNPVITSEFEVLDRIDFYTEDADSTVDILIIDTNGGFTLYLQDVTTNTRTAIINERPNEMHIGTIWYTSYCSGETATDNGTIDSEVNILDQTYIEDITLEVVRAGGSGVTVSFSVSSTLDTFLADGSLSGELATEASATNLIGRDLAIRTSSASQFYGSLFHPIVGTTTVGDVLQMDYAATSAYSWASPFKRAVVRGDSCLGYKVNCTSATATTEVYFGSAGTAQGWGFFHYFFSRPR